MVINIRVVVTGNVDLTINSDNVEEAIKAYKRLIKEIKAED